MRLKALIGKRKAQRLSKKPDDIFHDDSDLRQAGIYVVAWSIDGEPIQREFLWLEIPSGLIEFPRWKSKLAPMTLVECTITGRPSPPAKSWLPSVVVANDFEKLPLDEEFAPLAEQLRNPRQRISSSFGELNYKNLGFETYETKALWIDREIGLTLDGDFVSDVDGQIKSAEELLENADHWQSEAHKAILQHLYVLWRDTWSQPQDVLDQAAFLRRLNLQTISFLSKTSFQLYFDDGDTFSGHTIIVTGSIENGCSDAEIAG